jgi:short-subunit dehydrogenase
MNAVIIGGTSGLGLELAKKLAKQGIEVVVTGRNDPKSQELSFIRLDLSAPDLAKRMELFVKGLPKVDLFVYAAGYYQEGRITDLSEEQIEDMINVGGRGLIYSLRALLNKQAALPELITITSTSQWTPRQLEPIYNFVKAGVGHFTNSMAEDGRVAKVMVAGPAGMKTAFWKHDPGRDMSDMLDPEWVADQIMQARKQDYKYKYIRILRSPARVEEVETR